MNSIKMEYIVYSYGEHTTLKDFSTDIQDGEFTSVIGGGRSGEATVLELISDSLIPDQGEVYVQDKTTRKVDQSELRRDTGYVIQNIGPFPRMTVEENIDYVLSLTKQESPLIQKRVEEVMDIMKLKEQLPNRYPDELSGEQKQHAGIAHAFASHPKILLTDKPFDAVGEITRRFLQDEILRIYHKLHITIFFITHDIREALRLGIHVMTMKDSNIEQFDTPGAVKEQPQTEFARQLLSYLGE